MKYAVRFPSVRAENIFGKTLVKIPHKNIQNEIMDAVLGLADNPFPYGTKYFKRLTVPLQFYNLTAQYRLRVGNYRVLYDVDTEKGIVWILHLRKRDDRTYR